MGSHTPPGLPMNHHPGTVINNLSTPWRRIGGFQERGGGDSTG
tara:strand:- start:20 stop:148 length:129 start_codon:yes stop_codon:yes gene_type:complete